MTTAKKTLWLALPALLALSGLAGLAAAQVLRDDAASGQASEQTAPPSEQTEAEAVTDAQSGDTPFGAPDDSPPVAEKAEAPPPNADVEEILARFSSDPDRFTQTSGEVLYAASCRACHMADGKGAQGAGAYPPLAANPKLQSKYFIATVLLTGYHGMPRFGDQMDDAQIAAVANYARSSWGNDFPGTLSAEEVAKLRGERE